MYVIGTAGHVDHGKSTLVEALSGIDPDRLQEEKDRAMTIDLGFAWFPLPGDAAPGDGPPAGEMLGVVDVPGHRDFIENMLAGVGGIDAVVFVIAADEGVMPQTREHLAILDLLGVPGGVIALTKADLVDDDEWLELVALDAREITAGTVLDGAPIVPVSARTGQGIKTLLRALVEVLAARPPRADYGSPRLPIDRVFSMSGFGTVVTGTLSGGSLAVGDAVVVTPGEHAGRVRGLQAYKQKRQRVEPGMRVAVNLSGIDKDDIARGQVLTVPGWLRETVLVDVRYRHLPDASRPLKHNAEVKFFSGAAETVARARLLDADELAPGQSGWLQIRLEHPLALARGDRYILRFPSPGETIGGGAVIDPAPGRRWKRRQPEVIARLETSARGKPSELVVQMLERAGSPQRLSDLTGRGSLSDDETQDALAGALAARLALDLGGGWFVDAQTFGRLAKRARDELAAYHRAYPLRQGMPRERLRSRLHLPRPAFEGLLAALGEAVVLGGELLWLAGHEVTLTPGQQQAADRLRKALTQAPYTPPSFKEAVELAGEPVVYFLLEQRELVQVAPDVLLSANVYDEFMRAVAEQLDSAGRISARELRDRFNTTRKYAIGFLEHLDAAGITRRDGDDRVWNRRPRGL